VSGVERVVGSTPADRSLYNLLLANRPGLTTPEIYAIHRGLDVLLGVLLITNLMRSVGIFFGEDGAMSFSIAGPLITRPYLESLIRGLNGMLDSLPQSGGSDGHA
jgi:hypothetical protein